MRRPMWARSTPATETSKSSGSLGSAGIAMVVSLFTCVTPSHRYQPDCLTAPNMNGGVEFAFDHPNRLVAIFPVDFPERRGDNVIGIVENLHAECQPQPVLEH